MNKVWVQIKSYLNAEVSILDNNRSKWLFIIICALLSSLFLNIYDPLDIFDYYINSDIGNLFPIGYAGLVGSASMIITQFGVRKWTGPHHFKVYSLACWIILELSIISIVIFFFYGERGKPLLSEFSLTYQRTFLLAIVPYFIGLLFLYIKGLLEQNKTNKNISDFISVNDDKGKVIISTKAKYLLYLKSEDNYVEVHFLQYDKEQKSLIRNTLKNILSQLPEDDFVQIHRSYVINTKHVTQVNHSKGKTQITLDYVKNNPFTLSSTYKSSFESSLIR